MSVAYEDDPPNIVDDGVKGALVKRRHGHGRSNIICNVQEVFKVRQVSEIIASEINCKVVHTTV